MYLYIKGHHTRRRRVAHPWTRRRRFTRRRELYRVAAAGSAVTASLTGAQAAVTTGTIGAGNDKVVNLSGVGLTVARGTVAQTHSGSVALTGKLAGLQRGALTGTAAQPDSPPGVGSRTEARAGILRAGVTPAGMSRTWFRVFIDGVDRTRSVRLEECHLTEQLDGGAPTFIFSLYGLTPTLGQNVVVLQANPNDYLFGGTLTRRQPFVFGLDPKKVHWNCQATGYVWLLNRYALVTKRYYSQGINAIAADLLARYTDGGFRLGYAPSTLGTLAIDFEFASLEDCFNRLAEAATGQVHWEITPERIVNLYDVYPDGNLPPVTEASIVLEADDGARMDYDDTITEIRTRALARGAGSTATALAGPLATNVYLADVEPFSASGGQAVSGFSIFSYTGKSVASGPGALTGCTGIDYDIAEQDAVDLLVTQDDPTQQATLAAALGGGLSGIAVHLVDRTAGAGLLEAQRLADTDLAQWGDPAKALAFRYARTPRRLQVGRFFTAAITRPIQVGAEFRVQTINTTVIGYHQRTPDQDVRAPLVRLRRQVSASKTVRTLTQVLRKVA